MRYRFSIIVWFIIILTIGYTITYPGCLVDADFTNFPPPGFEIDIHRIELQPNEPFVELENSSFTRAPVLEEILNDAVYWAQRNMNQTQHWVPGEQLAIIFDIFNSAYIDKYGMTASQYAEAHNISRSDPVVKHSACFFAITQPVGSKMIIWHVELGETDPFVEWNDSVLESIQPLKEALDTAKAWAQHGVDEILYHFRTAFEQIQRAFSQAYEEKYGMDWYPVAKAHNSTFAYGPVVRYEGDDFMFGWSFAESNLPPLPWVSLVIVIGVISIGFVLLGVTLVNVRRLRSELKQDSEN